MTEYRVMAKAKGQKKFQCYGTHDEPRHADRGAESLAKRSMFKQVKVIVTDDNGVTNEIAYK